MDMQSVEGEPKLASGSLIQAAVTDFKDIYKSLNQIELLTLIRFVKINTVLKSE